MHRNHQTQTESSNCTNMELKLWPLVYHDLSRIVTSNCTNMELKLLLVWETAQTEQLF